MCRGGSRIFERGGVHLRSTSKKGGSKRGSNFGPNVKKPTSWPKRGGPDPRDTPPLDPPLMCPIAFYPWRLRAGFHQAFASASALASALASAFHFAFECFHQDYAFAFLSLNFT